MPRAELLAGPTLRTPRGGGRAGIGDSCEDDPEGVYVTHAPLLRRPFGAPQSGRMGEDVRGGRVRPPPSSSPPSGVRPPEEDVRRTYVRGGRVRGLRPLSRTSPFGGGPRSGPKAPHGFVRPRTPTAWGPETSVSASLRLDRRSISGRFSPPQEYASR